MDFVTVESVNVGAPRGLGVGGRHITTGLFKTPHHSRVKVGHLGVEGDFIGNPRHHGGADQAVYLYSREDLLAWRDDLGDACQPGFFGENLTIDRWWPEVRIGDRLVAESVVLEITAPRIPCATLAARVGNTKFLKRFVAAARPGAYARVVSGGELAAGDSFHIQRGSSDFPTVTDVFSLWYASPRDPDLLRAALRSPIASRARAAVEQWLGNAAES